MEVYKITSISFFILNVSSFYFYNHKYYLKYNKMRKNERKEGRWIGILSFEIRNLRTLLYFFFKNYWPPKGTS